VQKTSSPAPASAFANHNYHSRLPFHQISEYHSNLNHSNYQKGFESIEPRTSQAAQNFLPWSSHQPSHRVRDMKSSTNTKSVWGFNNGSQRPIFNDQSYGRPLRKPIHTAVLSDKSPNTRASMVQGSQSPAVEKPPPAKEVPRHSIMNQEQGLDRVLDPSRINFESSAAESASLEHNTDSVTVDASHDVPPASATTRTFDVAKQKGTLGESNTSIPSEIDAPAGCLVVPDKCKRQTSDKATDDSQCVVKPVSLPPSRKQQAIAEIQSTHAEIPEFEFDHSAPVALPDLQTLAIQSVLKVPIDEHWTPRLHLSRSDARAAPRLERSHLSREALFSFTARRRENETEDQILQRLQTPAMQDVNQRLRDKLEDKHATTAVGLLHSLRKQMSLAMEAQILEQVAYYKQLGESPARWTPEQIKAVEIRAPKSDALEDIEGEHNEGKFGPDLDVIDEVTELRRVASFASFANKQNKKAFAPVKSTWATTEEFEAQQERAKKNKPSKRNSRWATNSEVRAERFEKDSNAWGSVGLGDISTESGDSAEDVRSGRLPRAVRGDVDPGLAGYDGKLMAPPIEWNMRTRMKSSKVNTSSTNAVEELDKMFRLQYPAAFPTIPTAYVSNVDLHPDGITMKSRTHFINASNIGVYYDQLGSTQAGGGVQAADSPEGGGIESDRGSQAGDLAQALKGVCQPTDEQFDLERQNPEFLSNIKTELGLSETSEIYAHRYRALIAKADGLNSSMPTLAAVAKPMVSAHFVRQPARPPMLNVYLRPATHADLRQITDVYNYYVEHSTFPTELEAISVGDMQDNFDDSTERKLPFIVAVEKQVKKSRRRYRTPRARADAHPVQNTNPGYQALVAEEHIVGFAYAQDWTAHEFCERLTAEIEIYVKHSERLLGVGTVLMDKMLQICDRGHMVRGDHEFVCVPEKAHCYSEGGARDLHKVIISLRTWTYPRATPDIERSIKKSDREDACELWLKAWLESWGFEQEGRLKQVGARKGR
jgi:L-amino acid N-acyltransferase YncA